MIEGRTSLDGVVYYRSPLLNAIGVPHAFSTRIGGVSSVPFDSLNLGNPNGCAIQDPLPHIEENYRLLQRAAGCEGSRRYWVHQVHGATVAVVDDRFINHTTKADALVTTQPNTAISIRVADCVPVLLASEDGKTVAAAHAGWRGVVGGVVIEAFKAMNVPPDQIITAIGPSIGFDAFEVGSEVLDEFRNVFGAAAPVREAPHGKGFVDLRAAIAMQLQTLGVSEGRIDTNDLCTYRDRQEFFSHRRDNGVTGRMAALIATRRD